MKLCKQSSSLEKPVVYDYYTAQAHDAIDWCVEEFSTLLDGEYQSWEDYPHVGIALDNIKKKLNEARLFIDTPKVKDYNT